MGDKTGIEWTDATWNPSIGCSRVSPGCDHCYAMTQSPRQNDRGLYEGVVKDGDWTGRVNTAKSLSARMLQPIRWTRPRRIFVNSMSDLFHESLDDLFIAEVFAVMSLAPQHTFQVLTKRTKAMTGLLADPDGEFRYKMSLARRRIMPVGEGLPPRKWPLPNVWLGTSIESHRYVFRARYLLETPAAVRFLSIEPLVGPVPSQVVEGMDWVIAGGESGPGARPMHPDWVRAIRNECEERGIPFLFKQWGAWAPRLVTPVNGNAYVLPDGDVRPIMSVLDHGFLGSVGEGFTDGRGWGSSIMERRPKKENGRTLDGRTWDEYPGEVRNARTG